VSETRIVGVSLLRNEDVFVERALRNALGFCDELITLDDRSTDRTPTILARLAETHSKLRVHRIAHPRESNTFISGYAGQNVWVFSVDGDELFDPGRLATLRERVLAGEFADYWVVTAKAVHCTQVDRASMTATGYLSPPARGQGKLYNFRLLESWQGPTQERLHGGEPIFRGGHDARARRELHKEHGWDDAPFRLLHACFVRRSSRQAPWRRMRQNPAERYYTPPLDRLRRDTRRLLHLNPPPFGKDFSYRRGELVTVDARPFFRDD